MSEPHALDCTAPCFKFDATACGSVVFLDQEDADMFAKAMPPTSPARWAKLLRIRERDGEDCTICELPMLFVSGQALIDSNFPAGAAPIAATLDRIASAAAGGTDAERNLRLAHSLCKHYRGAYAPAEMKRNRIGGRGSTKISRNEV